MGSIGAQAQLAVEPGAAAHTFDSSSEETFFISENIKRRSTILHSPAITGNRIKGYQLSREGPYTVGGTLTVEPSFRFIQNWLPRMLGGTETTDVFKLTDELPWFGMLFNRVGGTFEYTDCKVSRWVLRGSEGGLLTLSLDIVGKTEVTGTAYPSISYVAGDDEAIMAFTDSTITIRGGARDVTEWELECNHNLEARFYNSRTAQDVREQGRDISFRAVTDFTSTEMSALYGTSYQGTTATIAMSPPAPYANLSSTITLRYFQVADESPEVGGVGEVLLTNAGAVTGDYDAASGSDQEIEWNHDDNNAT